MGGEEQMEVARQALEEEKMWAVQVEGQGPPEPLLQANVPPPSHYYYHCYLQYWELNPRLLN